MKIAFSRLQEALESDNYLGFCLKCGSDAFNVEPDARGYVCDNCGKPEVYGAEEILIMNRFNLSD